MRFPYFIPQHYDPAGGGGQVGGGIEAPPAATAPPSGIPPAAPAPAPPVAPAPAPGPAPAPAAPPAGGFAGDPAPAAPEPPPEPLTAEGVTEAVRQVLGEMLDPYAGQDPYGQQPGYDPYAYGQQPQQPQQPLYDQYTGQPLQPAAPPLPPLDPLDPQNFPNALQAHIGRYLDERLGSIQEAIQPLSGFAQEYAAERGRERASQMFGGRTEPTQEHPQGQLYGLSAQVGGVFDHERAMERAARYHYEGMPGPQALERAARDQFEFERGIRTNALSEYEATLRTNGRTTPQPPISGVTPAAPAPGVPTGPKRYEEQLARSLASMDGRQPPGYG